MNTGTTMATITLITMRLAAGLACGLSLVLGVTAARADDAAGLVPMHASDMSDERARAHFQAGTSLYDSGRFPEAAEEWEQAYALSGRAALLYNIYVAHRDASHLPQAIDALTRYLATDDPATKERLNLEARLRAMQAAQAAAEQDRKAGEASVAAPAPAPAEAQAEPAAPPPSAASDEADASGVPIVPLALVITSGALLAASVVTGLLTSGKVSDLEDRCPNDRCPAGFDLAGERSAARTLALVTDVLWIGGVVAGGVGAVLWLTASDETGEARAGGFRAGLTPSFACVPGACAGALRGSF